MLQKQVEDGLHNENAEQERFTNITVLKMLMPVEQQVNTASLDVNTGRPHIKNKLLVPSVKHVEYLMLNASPFEVMFEKEDNGLGSQLIKTRLGISKEVGTPRYLSPVVPLTKVGDVAVYKELGDRMERAATTASS
ncbi:hypothetical protein Tco_0597979 [Tanacetum coccineum]